MSFEFYKEAVEHEKKKDNKVRNTLLGAGALALAAGGAAYAFSPEFRSTVNQAAKKSYKWGFGPSGQMVSSPTGLKFTSRAERAVTKVTKPVKETYDQVFGPRQLSFRGNTVQVPSRASEALRQTKGAVGSAAATVKTKATQGYRETKKFVFSKIQRS